MSAFIKSDFCCECDHTGEIDGEQCESCEEWHDREVRADRYEDECKGN